jgi:hypothetical protein
MMRLLRVSVIVTLCLLTSAATAYAECAWVLWVSSLGPSGQELTNAWDSFTSLAECKKANTSAAMQKQVDTARSKGTSMSAVCLPDTVDPRGVRGK